MEFLFILTYIYILCYTLYFFILAIRNIKDRPFFIEKKYSKFESTKRNFAIIIYSHNHKECFTELVEQIKMQDYPLANFKLYAVLDDCNDGSEKIFANDNFIHVLNIQDVGYLGKNKAISLLLDEIKKDETIDAYIFIDSTRKIEADFISLANSALDRADAIIGEVNINRTNLDIVDKIKAVYKKYQANFFKQARTLLGLATRVDSGLFIVKKELVDNIDEIKLKDVNSELEFGLYLSQIGHKCVYDPNIQSYIYGQDCTFKNPNLSKRFELLKDNISKIKGFNFVFIEHLFSLLNPNFWTLVIAYYLLIKFSYKCQFIVPCNVVIFTAGLLLAIFSLSLVNAKLKKHEVLLLLFYPLYSICHIIKNLPPIRSLLKKMGANTDKEVDKLPIDVMVETNHGDRVARLEFISTESGLSKIRFIYKKNKYTTSSHLRMIDALQQLKSKMNDYNLTLKICSCCKYFESCPDGSTNMLKGECHNDFPSPLLNGKRQTLIWNSCNCFEKTSINNIIDEMVQQIEENKTNLS